MRTYQEIFDSYNQYNKKATRTAQGIEAGLALSQYFVGEGIKKKFTYTPPAKMQPSLANLSTSNLYDPAIRNLDRSFNTMLNITREQGRTPGASLLAAYGKNVEDISRLQSDEYKKTRNQEEMLNAQLINQAKQVNVGIDAKTADMNAEMNALKATQDSKTFSSISSMIANIGNVGARSVANELSAEVGLKKLSDEEALLAKVKADKEDSEEKKKLEEERIKNLKHPSYDPKSNVFIGPPPLDESIFTSQQNKYTNFNVPAGDTSKTFGGYGIAQDGFSEGQIPIQEKFSLFNTQIYKGAYKSIPDIPDLPWWEVHKGFQVKDQEPRKVKDPNIPDGIGFDSNQSLEMFRKGLINQYNITNPEELYIDLEEYQKQQRYGYNPFSTSHIKKRYKNPLTF